MTSSWFEYLGEIIKGFSEILFVKDPRVLTGFALVGVSLVTFSLTQSFSLRDAWIRIRRDYPILRKMPSYIRKNVIQTRDFLAFIKTIETVGLGYFISIVLLLLSSTYSSSNPSEISRAYVALINFAFVFIFVPTCIIALYYTYYRLFKNHSTLDDHLRIIIRKIQELFGS